ncbi:disease resistance protein RPS5-like [Macadamia integrifolia]|uniref:disease resistance protein RPS5-like n=1 Tax=Macadamia integrifolia TaxID=60698 RepID=UPI001C52B1A5|nr:disease resistance protein RPS5-like [Macadamia integrifolia]
MLTEKESCSGGRGKEKAPHTTLKSVGFLILSSFSIQLSHFLHSQALQLCFRLMAATPTVVQSSSSSSPIWDVFLSFGEEDTRHNFTHDLYASLVKEGIKTFKDDEKLRRGELISEVLEEAIKESRIFIVIFSTNYVNSRWCQEELTLIMERWEKHDQKVFPVFLMDVNQLNVQNQNWSFGELEELFGLEKGERWRSALRTAAQLYGWCFKDFGDEEKLIQKIVKDVIRYTKRKKQLLRPPPPEPVIEIPNKPVLKTQPSTESMLQQMFDWICDPDPCLGIIGIYGMGGVGKTTLAREVNNRFERDLANGVNIPFETVIMVTVSATPNIRRIQTYISKRLGLPDDSEAVALFRALMKKKFLLILDDVWSELMLEDVGIPCLPNDKGSKILVTSQNRDTCTDMGATKTINVHPLSESESWDLFVEKAGKHVAVDDIKPSAEKIVRRCKGLPLAIVIVAHAMAKQHGVEMWENASREMKQSDKDLRGMIDEVLLPLKFSYDSLDNEMLKSLFLYCACFPEDYNIRGDLDDMLNYWVGEVIVDQLGSLKASRDKFEDLIQSLKISCMLEDGEEKGSVRVHSIMRDLALWITSLEYSDSSIKFLNRTGISVKEAPKAHEWVNASRISLIDTQIKKFPELGEACQKLTAFLFRENKHFSVIPQTNFLQHMGHLRALDLSRSQNLASFPNSLSCLVNIRVLRLHMCKRLRALPLPVLGMLRQLQVLDLGWCSQLDQQILGGSECERLRYLDVKFSKVSIPAGVISGLDNLEELRFYASNKIKWRVNSGEEDEKMDGSESTSGESIIDVRELSCLTNLTSLTISFEDIIISDWFKPLANKIIALNLNHCTVEKQDSLEALNLDKSQNLWQLIIEDCPVVEKCNSLKMVFTEEMPRLFNNLKEIRVGYCVRVEVLIEAEEEEEE